MREIDGVHIQHTLRSATSHRPAAKEGAEELPSDEFRPEGRLEPQETPAPNVQKAEVTPLTGEAEPPPPQTLSPVEKTVANTAPPAIIAVEEPSVWNKIGSGIGKVTRKVGAFAKKLAGGTMTAIAVAPTLATLVAAREFAKFEGFLTGKESLSAIEWLQARTPKTFEKSLNKLFGLVGDSTVNSTGLSVDNLITIEKHFYKVLAPARDQNGVKRVAPYVEQLADAPFRQPDAPHAAFVYLGEGREKESKEVMDLWNGEKVVTENPYQPENDLHRVWEVLEHKAAEKELPVFIDLDGDARTFTSTEFIAKETLASMVQRNNNFGDGFKDAGHYYAWMKTRQDSYYQCLDPWLQQAKPQLHQRLECVKSDLTPPWLAPRDGLGPWPEPAAVDRAFGTIAHLAQHSQCSQEDLGNFSDAVIALDQDVLTGVQTHWIKLMRESGSERRSQLLTPLAKAWVQVNAEAVDRPEVASPPGAPRVRALDGPPAMSTLHPYDRAQALGEVVDHTLDGLGLRERKEFISVLKSELQSQMPALKKQEQEIRELLGEHYQGIDLQNVLDDRLSCADGDLHQKLNQLKSVIRGETPVDLKPADMCKLRRHHALTDWLVNSQKRYGDVQFGVLENSKVFVNDPFAVSEFYDQVDLPDTVTMLSPGPSRIERLGNPDAANRLKVSWVLEGGGGKGMGFPSALTTLQSGLTKAGYDVDEFVGNSAGAITALLLSAGYKPEELGQLMEQLDFKKFNSDAVWLMGGVDPKVRGIDRTGLFSMQKMYKTLHELIGKKTGVVGRPIMFRDLPFKLSVTGTVMNTDLPPGDPIRQSIGEDGRLVMSSVNTPNFDVVGAVIASASVPGYFNSPQMQIARTVEVAPGKYESRLHRIQFVDGGVVDNFPVSATQRESDGKNALVVLPAYYEGYDKTTGEKTGLATLNFDSTNLEAVEAYNREHYQKLAPKIDEFLADSAEQGVKRVVIGMNLTDLEGQTQPVLQGADRDHTQELHQTAEKSGLPHMSARQGRKFMKASVNGPGLMKKVAGAAFDLFLDGTSGEDDQFRWSLGKTSYSVGSTEEQNLLQIVRGTGAAALSASKEQAQGRLFES